MKKGTWCGLAALIAMVGLVGCSEPLKTENIQPAREPSKGSPKITIIQEKPTERRADDLAGSDQAPGAELLCQSDAECTVIPTDPNGCGPCLEGSGQRAVNLSTAKSIMGPRKQMCMPFIEKLKQGGQQPQRSQDQSCQFSGAKCVQGICQLANVPAPQGGGQGGPQGGPQGGVQGGGGFGGGNMGGGFGGNTAQPPFAWPDRSGRHGNVSQPPAWNDRGARDPRYGFSNNNPPNISWPDRSTRDSRYGFPQGGSNNPSLGNWGGDSSSIGFPQGYGRRQEYPGLNSGFGGGFGGR